MDRGSGKLARVTVHVSRYAGATLRRAAVVRVYEVEDRLVALAPDGRGHALTGDSAALAREVLGLLEQAMTGAQLLAEIEALAGAPIEDGSVIDELLAILLATRTIEVVDAATRPRRGGPGPRVLVGITGAVATMHTPALVQRLQARGFEVRVVATDSALRFVRTEALEALTHHPVVHGMWPVQGLHAVPHIELAQWADAVVVSPASATTIARMTSGDYASVVASIALATRAPVLLVPSMNPAMYDSPAVQRNLAQLRMDGMHVAHPGRGIEVAERPGERTPLIGGAPPPEVVVGLLEAILRARVGAMRPRGAEAWDRMHRSGSQLPWHSETADADMLAMLDELASAPTSVLEVGAGLGLLAVAAAERGHRVVASDLSSVVIEAAQARAPDASVVWLQDDITEPRLRGEFAVVIDRACLHVLTSEEVPGYVAAMRRLIRPGGVLIVKVLADEAAVARGVMSYTAATIGAIFGSGFERVREAASTLPGPEDAPLARLFVLRRSAG